METAVLFLLYVLSFIISVLVVYCVLDRRYKEDRERDLRVFTGAWLAAYQAHGLLSNQPAAACFIPIANRACPGCGGEDGEGGHTEPGGSPYGTAGP